MESILLSGNLNNLKSKGKENLNEFGYCCNVEECSFDEEQKCMSRNRNLDCFYFMRIPRATLRPSSVIRGIRLPIEKVEVPSKEIDLTLLSRSELSSLKEEADKEVIRRNERLEEVESHIEDLSRKVKNTTKKKERKFQEHKESEDIFSEACFKVLTSKKYDQKIIFLNLQIEEKRERIQSLTR